MTFDDYQKKSRKAVALPINFSNLMYLGLALSGETGEVAEKIKKLFRDKDGRIDNEFRGELAKELGDILWYVTRTCEAIDMGLSQVAQINLGKIMSRKERNLIHGSGDNR